MSDLWDEVVGVPVRWTPPAPGGGDIRSDLEHARELLSRPPSSEQIEWDRREASLSLQIARRFDDACRAEAARTRRDAGEIALEVLNEAG